MQRYWTAGSHQELISSWRPDRPGFFHSPIKGEKTLAELAQLFDVHPNQISTWRTQLLEGAQGVFGGSPAGGASPAVDLKELHAKIGQLTLENDFLAGALTKAGLLSAKK